MPRQPEGVDLHWRGSIQRRFGREKDGPAGYPTGTNALVTFGSSIQPSIC